MAERSNSFSSTTVLKRKGDDENDRQNTEIQSLMDDEELNRKGLEFTRDEQKNFELQSLSIGVNLKSIADVHVNGDRLAGCDSYIDDSAEIKLDVVEEVHRKPLTYRVSEQPPFYLLLLCSFQQCLIPINAPLIVAVMVAEVTCSRNDDAIKAQIISATMVMSGLSTLAMTTIGVRLPIFQGPTIVYLINLVAMSDLPEWKCPTPYQGIDPQTNSTIWLALYNNQTDVPMRSIIYAKLGELSGSLMLAGLVHCLIGATGLVGVLTRYVGPVTIVPCIVLVGLNIYKVTFRFARSSWTVTFITAGCCVILALYLSKQKTPIPFWTPKKGFHIVWYPLHQTFAILTSMLIGWGVSAVMTSAGVFSDNPKDTSYLARTDSRTHIIYETDWFTLPYPGRLGANYSLNVGAFMNFLLITFLSVMDSIGDYSATARVARVTPPPPFAFNRGIAVEGLMTILAGAMGCCHGTVSHGDPIGIMEITRVVSRRVFQLTGVMFIVFGCLGKLGAVLISIPYPVLGGSQIVNIGIFIGVVLSYLQTIDLNSTRNTAIVGMALLLGLILPYWMQESPSDINTGNPDGDSVIRMLLSNPSFIGGVFACILDNTVPGSLKERGLSTPSRKDKKEDPKQNGFYEDGPETYRLPLVPDSVRRSKFAKYIPLIEYLGD